MAGEIKKLKFLHPSEYEHPLDREALQTLEGTPGLETLTRKLFKHGVERYYRLQYTGSYIKANENHFSEVHDILVDVCNTLHLKKIPELYIEWDYRVNGRTIGSENPIIILKSGAIDLLTEDELRYVIGHEVGHIKSGHMLYHIMAEVIPIAGDIIGTATLGIGGLISTGLELALLYWNRMSEFTADRAGLLACQNEDAAINAMIKMAGAPKTFFDRIDRDQFIEQAREFKGYDYDNLDKVGKTVLIMGSTHPWTVMRASEILDWVESGAYSEIIEKHTGSQLEIDLKCHKCGTALTGDENFCGICGSRLWGR
ncbi:M48 family metalloprotease [Methanothermobacter marburgensis]|uniref:Predicted protease n=1 Tax=Methanothermobacter marburgensis (strain ATCC BAA-927 / DSM 2133 / JCM 14651 / NBRC 100331 / OCM 82 / Marburg) TaxID=79929 RepID=D9PW57_METTM|nr:M48 family metallopeptidase [Methanothermobacter marburgensis]ADL58455.1 predicted protease [Methanothermobacter marburgensis str. Marburg]WBF10585.1 M48 family metalloprotease [Methanothermobacter marburgensis]